MKGSEHIHIGTSGWHYEHWRGPFYPQGLDQEDFLLHYAQRLRTVEVNNSFYQLPARETLVAWRDAVPKGFVFAVKASRYITHMKKLSDPVEPIANFIQRVSVLENKLGPILFQLPPNWHCDIDRLGSFLSVLPSTYRYAFEFRDPTWFNKAIYEVLSEYKAAFCMYTISGKPSPRQVTADFIYVRFHGPDGPYEGKYDTTVLAGWAGAFSTWARDGKEIYGYFNNDPAGHAPLDALRLRAMIEE